MANTANIPLGGLLDTLVDDQQGNLRWPCRHFDASQSGFHTDHCPLTVAAGEAGASAVLVDSFVSSG